jgi:hypothetical protein
MNRAHALAMILIWSSLPSPAVAGDLAELPKDQAGFQAKLRTFIRPGARMADVQRLLESDRFHCELSIDAKGSFLSCDRTDASPLASVQQRYQVVLRTDGTAITSVRASTSPVGP